MFMCVKGYRSSHSFLRFSYSVLHQKSPEKNNYKQILFFKDFVQK